MTGQSYPGYKQLANPVVFTGSPPLRIPLNASSGMVLTSDALGNASWQVASAGTTTWYNVETYGAKGNGSTDDTTAIQAAINAANTAGGGVVYFPAGTYIVSSTIQLYAGIDYLGAEKDTTIIQQATGSNLDAVAATTGWSTNVSQFAIQPLAIRELSFRGQPSQVSGSGHGLVLQTFWSYVEDCTFENTKGDGARLDYYTVNGTTPLQNSNGQPENRFLECQFRTNGAYGFHVHDDTYSHFTDGYLIDCITATSGLSGIYIQSGAGWLVQGCHINGTVPQSGIVIGRMFATRVIGNYIESWAGSSSSGTYCAIDATYNGVGPGIADGGFGSVIAGNVAWISAVPGNAGSSVFGIGIGVVSANQGEVAITGNMMSADASLAVSSRAYSVQAQDSTAIAEITFAGNAQPGSWGTPLGLSPNGGVIALSGDEGACTFANTTGQAITSTAPTTVTGLSAGVIPGTYQIRTSVPYSSAVAAGTPLFAFTGPSASAATLTGQFATASYTAPAVITTLAGAFTGPTLTSSANLAFRADGVVTFSTAGTFALTAAEGSASDAFTVAAGSYLQVIPVP